MGPSAHPEFRHQAYLNQVLSVERQGEIDNLDIPRAVHHRKFTGTRAVRHPLRCGLMLAKRSATLQLAPTNPLFPYTTALLVRHPLHA